jgi:hypothetical protein
VITTEQAKQNVYYKEIKAIKDNSHPAECPIYHGVQNETASPE